MFDTVNDDQARRLGHGRQSGTTPSWNQLDPTRMAVHHKDTKTQRRAAASSCLRVFVVKTNLQSAFNAS
jgi:hypothetical protein